MSANGANMEAFGDSKVLWWVLLMILFQAFQKKIIFQKVVKELFINRSVVSSLGMSANPVTIEAFKDSKVLLGSC